MKNFEYRIGVPIRFYVALTYHDDTPVLMTDSNRDILIGQKHNGGSNLVYSRYQLNANGTVKVEIIGDGKAFEVIVRNDQNDQ